MANHLLLEEPIRLASILESFSQVLNAAPSSSCASWKWMNPKNKGAARVAVESGARPGPGFSNNRAGSEGVEGCGRVHATGVQGRRGSTQRGGDGLLEREGYANSVEHGRSKNVVDGGVTLRRWSARGPPSGNPIYDATDRSSRREVLGQAIRHIRTVQGGAAVKEAMEAHYSYLGREELAVIFSKQDWRVALDIFEWMDESGRVEGDCRTYMALLKVLGDAGQLPTIQAILSDLEGAAQVPDGRLYESVMNSYARAKEAHVVVDLFDRMVQAGVQPGPKAFNLVMVALQKAKEPRRWLPQAERILVQMNTQRLRDVVPYNCMLNIYLQAGQHKKALRLLRDMEELGLAMDMYTFNAALQAFGQGGNVDAAVDLIKWLASHKDYEPTVYTFTIMVGIYARADRLEEAVELLEDMRARGMQGDTALYNCLLSYLGSAGLADDAALVYEELKVRGPTPDVQTYALAVVAHGVARRLSAVGPVLEDMQRAGCPPTEAVWSAMAGACGQCINQDAEVNALLRQVRDLGWAPQAEHVALLLRGYRKEQAMPEEVLRACQEVRSSGAPLDDRSWRTLVGFYFYRGNLEEVLAALDGMRADGHVPGQATLNMLLDLHGLKGNVAEAKKVFQSIKEAGQVDLVSCSTMMNAYAQSGMPQEAQELLGSMRAEGLVPDARVWTLAIKAHGNAGDAAGALEAYWAMLDADCPLDEIAYNTVINVCGRELTLEATLQCYRNMQEEGFRPNAQTRNLVLSLLAKSDRLSQAEDMFKKLARSGKADAVTYCTMADAYGKRRHLDRMEEVLVEAREEGMQLGPSIFNAMIDAYGKAGMHSAVEKTLRRMEAGGVPPNTFTFNAMLHAYGTGNLMAEMEDVLLRMQAAGVERDSWTYNILIGAYGESEMPHASVKVFREMQDAGMAPDAITYQNLIKAFRRAGDFLEAARWSLWMKQAGFKGHLEEADAASWFSFTPSDSASPGS